MGLLYVSLTVSTFPGVTDPASLIKKYAPAIDGVTGATYDEKVTAVKFQNTTLWLQIKSTKEQNTQKVMPYLIGFPFLFAGSAVGATYLVIWLVRKRDTKPLSLR